MGSKMVESEVVSVSGLKAPSADGVRILEERLAVTVPHGPTQLDGSRVDKVVVGGGAGGLILYLANTFVVSPELRNILVYLAPGIGIVLMSIYSFGVSEISKSWKSYQEERARKTFLRRMREAQKDAKEQLASIEADPHSTDDHKKLARERFQLIQRKILELNVRGFVVFD